jgi:hypothetical protein
MRRKDVLDEGMLAIVNFIHLLDSDVKSPRFAEGCGQISAWVGKLMTRTKFSGMECVIDDESIHFSLISDGSHDAKVNIFWEDCGHLNYKSLGLYGQMSVLHQDVYRRNGLPRELIIAGNNYVVQIKV